MDTFEGGNTPKLEVGVVDVFEKPSVKLEPLKGSPRC